MKFKYLYIIILILALIPLANAVAPVADFNANVTSGGISLPVGFTDASTNSPSVWAWFFGDETYTQTWIQQCSTAAWAARAYHGMTTLPNGSILIIGGTATNDANDTWISTNKGASWTNVTGTPGWIGRNTFGLVTFQNGTITLIGGATGATRWNDTWRSTDSGVTWTRINNSFVIGGRSGFATVLLSDESIVIMGGTNSSGTRQNDTWRSTDSGTTWTRMNASSGWVNGRLYPSAIVVPDQSIIFMGGFNTSYFNDTWRSTDKGATWTQINSSSGWQPRYSAVTIAMPDNSIMLMGGKQATPYVNDTWRSTDYGKTWTSLGNATWSPRYFSNGVLLPDGSVVIAGGTGGTSTRDVWRFNPVGSSLQNPTHVYTLVGTYNVSLTSSNTDGYNTSLLLGYITATNGTVIANFTSNISSGFAPLPVNFIDSSSGSPTTWTWNATNVTGNNTPFTFSTSQNPIYTFGVGNFSIKLNASDSISFNNTPGTYFINVSLLATPPVASFTTNVTSGYDPVGVMFNDTSTNVPTSWQWNATNITGNNTPFTFSITQNNTYTFGVGNFSIKLNVSNTGGSNISSQTTFINVSPRISPISSFTSNTTSGLAPLPVQFNDTSLNSPTIWNWFFGDETYNQAWVRVNASSGFAPRFTHSSVVMPDGSIILTGGNSGGFDKNDTWRSTDNGTTWTLMNDSSGWTIRNSHSTVAIGSNIILIGGYAGGRVNDTWRSTDNGATWTNITGTPGWIGRNAHSTVVLQDGSIVLMGGVGSAGSRMNDTWRSIDQGITWTLMNSSSGWTARTGQTAVALLDNSIILMGGSDGNYVNDTWRSTDNGATWTRLNASAEWSARYEASSTSTLNNDILLLGGSNGAPVGNHMNDTWLSRDKGVSWILTNASSGWTARDGQSSNLLPDGSIVLIGGNDVVNGSKNDTWKLTPQGSTIQNPVHTYTIAGNFSVLLRTSNAFGSNTTPGKYYVNVTALPVSNFTSNVTIATIYPMVVQFNDTTINFPTMWNWSFGDGRWFNTTNSSLKNPIYTYAVAGKYTTNLTTSNTLGSHGIAKINYTNLTSDTDNNLSSWLHMNGTNGSTTFRDEMGLAWAANGNAKIVTNNFKYGGASAYFDGSGDYLSTTLPSAFNFSAGDFTLEFWVNVSSIASTDDHIISKTNNPRTRGWGLDCTGGNDSGWDFWMGNDTTGQTPFFTIPNKTWTHIAVERQGGTLYVYVNGNLTVSKSGYNADYNTPDPIWIGRQSNNYFTGYIDEFRVSTNASRWKANFTPPYNEYRGLLETLYYDENPDSTFRYKTDPTGSAYVDNMTQRNRTLQIQNVTNTSYVIGSMLFQPQYGYVKSIQLNTSTYTTGMSIVCATIDNTNGIIEFNVSRPLGFNNGSVRASILDYTIAYTNYTDGTDIASEYFSYGYLINTTINKYYPIHNFLGTPVTYGDWNFTANFTATNTTILAGTPTTFNATFNGSYPNRWNWSFGDGTFDNGTNSIVTHIYTMGGNHTVTLTEYLWQNSSVNNTKTRTNYINVTNLPTLASFTSVSSGGPLPPVTVAFTDTSTNYPYNWNWSFGDGNVSALQNPTHVYDVCGNLTVLLRVENAANVSWSNKTDYLNIPCFIPTPPPGADARIAMRMEDIGNFVVIAAIILTIALVATFIYLWVNKRS
jgi:PKD repeat protein